MHLYMMTRGIKHEVDRFINELSAKYLPPSMITPDVDSGEKKDMYYSQLQIRPIQLWEVVFPKEHLDIVLTTIFPGGDLMQHKKHAKFVWGIRKILGAKAIPKEWDNNTKMMVHRAGLETVGIGLKDDYTREDGTEAL